MGGLPDPDWYFDHVLVNAEPGTPQLNQPGPAEPGFELAHPGRWIGG